MNVDSATTWYRSGQQQLKAGDTKGAIDSFRNATTNDHDNGEYTLALATALAAADHVEEARQALLRLRASAPENGGINLSLARLSAKEGKTDEAVRYYHNALFGIWPPDRIGIQRPKVRTELVEFLLDRGDASQALSELLILSSDMPDTEAAHNEVARLFLAAGDSQHALEQFTRTLRLNAKNVDALSGAGQATFNLQDYSRARRYLDAAVANGSNAPDVSTLMETTRLVLSRDPLAPGIRMDERIRRLTTDLDSASEELQSCINKTQDDESAVVVLGPLLTEIDQGIQSRFHPQILRREPDEFTTGLSLIHRVDLAVEQICDVSSPLHTALVLIARKHGVGEQ